MGLQDRLELQDQPAAKVRWAKPDRRVPQGLRALKVLRDLRECRGLKGPLGLLDPPAELESLAQWASLEFRDP